MTGNKLKLTKRSVEMLIEQHLPGRAQRVWDTEIAPFYLNLTPNGVASYRLRFTKANGVKSDFTIGRANVIGPDQARDVARAKMADLVANNIDPVIARTTSKIHARGAKSRTFKAVAQGYIAERYEQQVTKKPLMDEYILDRYVLDQIGHLDVTEITTKTVKNLIKKIPATVQSRNADKAPHRTGLSTANRVQGTVRRVLQDAVDGEVIVRNPASFTRLFDPAPTKRVGRMSDERFRLVWNELDQKAQQTKQLSVLAIQLYMITLQRLIDISRARRSHFDLKAMTWQIPSHLTKTGVPYYIPISPTVARLIRQALAETSGMYLFPSTYARAGHLHPASMRARFNAAVEELKKDGRWPEGPAVELYDCRRFGRTQLVHRLGFTPEVAERVINHAERRDMKIVYDVHDYSPAIREAHEAWAVEVLQIIGGGSTK